MYQWRQRRRFDLVNRYLDLANRYSMILCSNEPVDQDINNQIKTEIHKIREVLGLEQIFLK